MKERPIVFSGPMVRAIIEGRKTQTRRIIANPERFEHIRDCDFACRYGIPGDRLWVRETFKAIASGEIKNGYGEVRHGWAYQADGATRWKERPTIIHDLTNQPPTGPMQFRDIPWKPSIHMPRRASRLTLEITGVRVERLQEISESDATAEGIEARPFPGPWWQGYRDDGNGDLMHQQAIGETPPEWMIEPKRMRDQKHLDRSAKDGFRALWCQIHSSLSWDANPWVWAISFKRVQ